MNQTIQKRISINVCKYLLALVLLGTQLACTATTLPPYEAKYTTKLRGIKISGTRTFEAIEGNRYRVSWRAKALWMRLNEWSEFEIIDDQVKPLSYHYTRKGLGTDRPVHVYFDWENMQVSGSKGKNKYSFALEEGTQDKLSYQVQMQLDLLKKPEMSAVTYQVATHSTLKNYHFNFERKETIETALGDRETLLFVREKKDAAINIWLAPAHYYLPIQVVQTDEDGDKNSLIIRSWKSEAKPYNSIALTQQEASTAPLNSAIDPLNEALNDDF